MLYLWNPVIFAGYNFQHYSTSTLAFIYINENHLQHFIGFPFC